MLRLLNALTQLDRELANLTQALATSGGDSPETVLREIRRREQRRTATQQVLTDLDRRDNAPPVDLRALRLRLLALLADWQGLAARHVGQARQLLRKLLVGRLQFVPLGAGLVRFTGEGTLAPLVGRLEFSGVPASVTPAGFEPAISTLKGSRPWPG